MPGRIPRHSRLLHHFPEELRDFKFEWTGKNANKDNFEHKVRLPAEEAFEFGRLHK